MEFTEKQKIEYLEKCGYTIKRVQFPTAYSSPNGKYKIKLNYENNKKHIDIVCFTDDENDTISRFILENKIDDIFIIESIFENTTIYKEFIDNMSIDNVFNDVITKKILKIV